MLTRLESEAFQKLPGTEAVMWGKLGFSAISLTKGARLQITKLWKMATVLNTRIESGLQL